MYDPYALDRIHFEQSERDREVRVPRAARARQARQPRRHFARFNGRRAAVPCTD